MKSPAAGNCGARNADRVGAATGTRDSTTPAQFPNNLKAVARALDGEVCGREVLAPGPGHSAKDRSLSVRPSTDAPDGFLAHSFAGDDWQACRDYIASRLGFFGLKAAKLPARPEPREPRQIEPDDEKSRTQRALKIWRESISICGTLAEFYLTEGERKLTLDMAEILGHVLRFHPACPFGVERNGVRLTEYAPAMIALMCCVRTDAPRCIQRTRLAPDGTKLSRAMLGPSGGAAIKLDADENVTLGLVITEGCETGLAARQVGYGPVWALGSTGAIKTFPVLPVIQALTIHVELGDGSLKAVHECGARWREAGREVIVFNSLEGSDLNDAIRARPAT